MVDDCEKLSTGPNEPGIPDNALGPGEEMPSPPSDEEVERAAERLKAPISSQRDTLPLDGE